MSPALHGEPEPPSGTAHTNTSAQLKIKQLTIIIIATSFGLAPVPSIDHKLVFVTAWSGSWPRTQVLPTEPGSLAEPDSSCGSGSAQTPSSHLSSYLQGINPACKCLGWLLASCGWEGREEGESRGEASPRSPQSGSIIPAATILPNTPCRGSCSPGPCQLGGDRYSDTHSDNVNPSLLLMVPGPSPPFVVSCHPLGTSDKGGFDSMC